MSRVAKAPVSIPAGVEVKLNGQLLTIKGKNGELSRSIHHSVEVKHENNELTFSPREGVEGGNAQSGTARALVNSMVIGVTEGFTRKLQLVGVGYRAQIKGNAVALSLGFSHPVEHVLPAGILVKTSTPAADVASILLGKGIGAKLITVGILISVFGTLNGSVLISTRIPYIMALHNELPYSKKFTKLHPKFKTSFASFALMFVIGGTMTFLGTFNTLADMAMFSWWIFNVLAFVGVIKFRKDCPDIERPYRVPLYPFVPVVAIIGGIVVLVSALLTQTTLALTGLALTGSGMIVYYFVKRNETYE